MPEQTSDPRGESTKPVIYRDLLTAIQSNPHSYDVWSKTVALARKEERVGGGTESYYSHIPIEELIAVGSRLRTTKGKTEQYQILTERCSTGERWYNVVLGHVNDKMFSPIVEELDYLRRAKGEQWGKGLDMGSGTGNTLRAIAPNFKEVVGVDILESVLHTIKHDEDLPKNASVVVADATKLPFNKDTFDIATSNGLTYYLSKDEIRRYAGEIARVLKPGGLYFESFIGIVDGSESLAGIETEYLTSAKAMLVCLVDNIVSLHKQDWNLREFVDAFAENGLDYEVSEANPEGTWFIRFQKAAGK